ncbi:PadR family transcriptional regulator [Brevundimonas sp. DC300-4]|uniref:PadR family transcriptional regulator n=1 Tax=unclassified Brevundimonas TaxID=2622653 RepID=UPI003CEAF802
MFGHHRLKHDWREHRCGPEGEGRGREGRGHGRGRSGGPGMFGGRGGPGRRMFGPGDLRIVALALIEKEPRHGYDLIKAIEAMFGGAYAPSPGVVYPTLSMLADEGLIAGVEDSAGKRIFTLTGAGQAWLNENRAAVDGVMQRMALAARLVSGEQTPDVVKEALHTLRQAVIMKPGEWSDLETARVVESLMRAVREVSGQ